MAPASHCPQRLAHHTRVLAGRAALPRAGPHSRQRRGGTGPCRERVRGQPARALPPQGRPARAPTRPEGLDGPNQPWCTVRCCPLAPLGSPLRGSQKAGRTLQQAHAGVGRRSKASRPARGQGLRVRHGWAGPASSSEGTEQGLHGGQSVSARPPPPAASYGVLARFGPPPTRGPLPPSFQTVCAP